MLTISDALQFSEFAGAVIVAGHSGLERSVAWVHVVAVPDAAQWLNGGELVLTTANTLPQGHEEQRQYIQALAEKKVAGLALAVGRFIERAPDALRQAADECNFPLIEISFQARFIDIAKAVNQRIAASNMENVERALHIHRVLTQLVLEGGDLQRLAVTLAGLIGQSVSIENERFEALASHNIADYDEARRYTLREGRTDPRLVRALEERGIISEIHARLRPVHIPQMVDVGLEMERILAPVVVHGDLYGYIWIIADDRPLSNLDRLAIESGATVAALMIFYQEAVQNAEASLKGGLLAQLIQYESGREAILTDLALRYDVDLNAGLMMLLIDSKERSSQRLLQIDRRISRLIAARGWRAVVGQFAGQVIVLMEEDEQTASAPLDILNALNGETEIARSSSASGARHVAVLHRQCQDALSIGQRLKLPAPIYTFAEMGYLHTLYRAGSEGLEHNPFIPPLRMIAEEQGADLFHTLEVFLDAGGNTVQTAELLMIHRSTLNYRLKRIEELTRFDLSAPLTRTNLQVALKLLRLFDD
jgi:purine catabolism regulator